MIDKQDAEIVRQCLAGNLKAFETIIDKYQKPMFHVAMRMTGNMEDAKDITQTVFIKAFENLSGFNSQYKMFSWLYRMTINETLNFLETRKNFESLTEETVSSGPDPERRHEQTDMTHTVDRALKQLDDQNRALIVLKHFCDLSYKEIAEIFNVPEKTIKSRLYTSRQLLKEIFFKSGLLRNDR